MENVVDEMSINLQIISLKTNIIMLRFKHTKIFSMFFLIEFLSIILILKTIFPNNNYNECLSARNKRLLSILKII